VRLALIFVLASAFLVAGLFFLCYQAFIATFFSMDAIGMGIIFTFIGGAWLWADFVRPMLRGEKIS
jgi:hypothetical protein